MIISCCNIVQFIRRSVENDNGFYKLSPDKKREAIRKLAEAVKKENDSVPVVPPDMGGL